MKLKVLPNPYGALDHEGLLAGACPEGEELRSGGMMPMRRYVGAQLNSSDYVTRPEGYGQDRSRARLTFTFADDTVDLEAPDSLAAFYAKRIRQGSLVDAKDKAKALSLLAEHRAKAIAQFESAHGGQPPIDKWEAQFALDKDVVAAGKQAAPATPQGSK